MGSNWVYIGGSRVENKFFYAQLDLNNNVIGVSELAGEVINSNLIKLYEYNSNILGYKYQDGIFLGERKTKVDNNNVIEILSYDPITKVADRVSQVTEPLSDEELLEDLKQQYIPLINETNLLGDIAEKERLQQEYLTKKAEIMG